MHTNPEVLALLALGEDSASASERAHVETCEVCTREVAEFAHLAGVGRLVSDATPLEKPSPEVWRRIQAELGFTVAPATAEGQHSAAVPSPQPALAPPVETRTATAGSSPKSRRVLALVLAAALALIVGIGIGLGWNSLSRQSPTVVGEAQLESVAEDWSGASGEATLERDASGQRILVVRVTTPREVPGLRIVWVMDTTFKKMQTIGQLTGTEGRFTIDSRTNLADFPVVDVSEEPSADTDPVHSGITIVRGTLNV